MQICTSRIPGYTPTNAMIMTLRLASKRHKTNFPLLTPSRALLWNVLAVRHLSCGTRTPPAEALLNPFRLDNCQHEESIQKHHKCL